jgi:tetrahydromethanopterin S-methyltransferase subunit G
MAEESKQVVPTSVVDPDQFNELMARLDKIEEKIEFYSGEKFLRAGKSVGRDLGAAYGVCAGLIIILAYVLFMYAHNWTPVLR